MSSKCCAKCNKPFQDGESFLTAIDNDWHKDCFVCGFCNKPFPNIFLDIFLESGTHIPLHKDCQRKKEQQGADKCGVCGKPLLSGETVVSIGDGQQQYHQECFTCAKCRKPLFGGGSANFVKSNNKPYHVGCMRMSGDVNAEIKEATKDENDKCVTCKKKITGAKKVNDIGQFHPECFMCDTCDKHISGNTYYKHPKTNMPMCERCMKKLTKKS